MRAALLVLPFLAACQLEQSVNPVVAPANSAVEQFEDLPVPRNMRLVTSANQSRSLERGKYRTAQLDYVGSSRLSTLEGFLRERLPEHGWQLVQEERPTRERLMQRWISLAQPGVQYLLVTVLADKGNRRSMRYELRTRRAVKAMPKASSGANASTQRK